jgi:molybdenum cofactor cytidylyltransferase
MTPAGGSRAAARARGPDSGIAGILLAAGSGRRYGGAKLLARLDGVDAVGPAACRHLLAAVPWVIAVVRPDDRPLAAALAAVGAQVVPCPEADDGMGASLACGLNAAAAARGWVVALADMPWIAPATIARVAAAVAGGALVAAPFFGGTRGHPVGFGEGCRAELAALAGDAGAREVVAAHADRLLRLDVDDPGILRDVDTPADLRKAGR